jgi:single-stranded-DNA-specific exonuclease
MLEAEWALKTAAAPELAAGLAEAVKIPELFAQLLISKGLTTPEQARSFLFPSLDDLVDPLLMSGLPKAVDRLEQAIDGGEGIMIFGDYDVDGITASYLLQRWLSRLGARVSYFIPDRVKDGYGLSIRGIDEAASRDCSLVITVDCGISAYEEIDYARTRGIDVLVTDHHEPLEKLPDALAIVNPKQQGCPYPFKHLAGVGISFKLIQALLTKRSPTLAGALVEEDLDVVALGTIADVVPLIGENRVLATYGIKSVEHSHKLGLNALKEAAGLGQKAIASYHVAFILAPRINAAGRLGDAGCGVRLFLSSDRGEAEAIAESLEEDNARRRQLDQQILKEAEAEVEQQGLSGTGAIVLWSDTWHPGVLGIVASRLVERLHRPVILVSVEGGKGKGSARSVPGFDLWRALSQCQEYLTGFGGHSYAAGLAIDEERLPQFRDRMVELAERELTKEMLLPKLQVDVETGLDECTREVAQCVSLLSPFGYGNTEPVFATYGAQVMEAWYVGRNNIRCRVQQNGRVLECIGFGFGEHVKASVLAGSLVDLAFVPVISTWRREEKLELKLKSLRFSR